MSRGTAARYYGIVPGSRNPVTVTGLHHSFFQPVHAYWHPAAFLTLILLSAAVLYIALDRLKAPSLDAVLNR